MDERLHKIHDMIDRGLDEISIKGSFDKDTIVLAKELVDMKKDIATIEAMESEYPDKGYSEDYSGRSYVRKSGRYNDNSYTSRRPDYNVRDYNRGYSRKDEMISSLEDAMRKATTEQERESIRRMIVQAENA